MQHPTAVPSATGAPWDQAPGPLASAGFPAPRVPPRAPDSPSLFFPCCPAAGGRGRVTASRSAESPRLLPPPEPAPLSTGATAIAAPHCCTLLLPPLIAAHWRLSPAPQSLRAAAPVEYRGHGLLRRRGRRLTAAPGCDLLAYASCVRQVARKDACSGMHAGGMHLSLRLCLGSSLLRSWLCLSNTSPAWVTSTRALPSLGSDVALSLPTCQPRDAWDVVHFRLPTIPIDPIDPFGSASDEKRVPAEFLCSGCFGMPRLGSSAGLV